LKTKYYAVYLAGDIYPTNIYHTLEEAREFGDSVLCDVEILVLKFPPRFIKRKCWWLGEKEPRCIS